MSQKFAHKLTKITALIHISNASTSPQLKLLAALLAVGTGAVGDVVVRLVVLPVGLGIIELEVVEVTELVAVKSVDGSDVEGAVDVLDPMLAVGEDWLAAFGEVVPDGVEAVAERLEAVPEILDAALVVLDVKMFTADNVPDATLDTAETVLPVTGAAVVPELPDAAMVGIVADPTVAADDSVPAGELGEDCVADPALLAAFALPELGAELATGAALV